MACDSTKEFHEHLMEMSNLKGASEDQLIGDDAIDLNLEEQQIKMATEARRAELIAEKLRGRVRW